MTEYDDVMASIDGALADWEVGPDAVRWVPEDQRTERPAAGCICGDPECNVLPSLDLARAIYSWPGSGGWVQTLAEQQDTEILTGAARVRADLFMDMLLWGSAFLDPNTGRRVPPEDVVVRPPRIEGQQIRAQVFDEASGWRDVGYTIEGLTLAADPARPVPEAAGTLAERCAAAADRDATERIRITLETDSIRTAVNNSLREERP